MMSSAELFTREKALGGLPAKRARVLLFLIESRAAHRAAREREIPTLLLAPEIGVWHPELVADAPGSSPAEREEESDLLTPFRWTGERLPPVTIQQIERYARDWAALVPENPRLRAATARLLGQKYRLTERATPGIRAALGLDQPEVRQTYQRLYGETLAAIYAPHASARERLRWVLTAFAKWLDSLPAFWFAFAFTLTETVGAGVLALPIALARLGILAGVAVLVLFGVINVLTIICMAEAVARSGVIRYGSGFIGRLVADRLGGAGSLVFTAGTGLMSVLFLQVYYLGFATVLAGATHVPAPVWTAALFAVCLYLVTRRGLHATVASALLIGAVNIGLILALSALALACLHPENLRAGNVLISTRRLLDRSVLEVVFGVGTAAFYGHLSVGNCARLVLHREPSGRGLIAGCGAAQVAALVLYCLFLVAIQGAIGSHALAGYAGTSLEPLARVAGPGVWILGSVFAILGMGMAAVHHSLSLFGLVSERLPIQPRFLATLDAAGGRLILEPPGDEADQPRIGMSYQGLDGSRPRVRVDVQVGSQLHSLERTLDGPWDARELSRRIPAFRKRPLLLTLEPVEASEESVSLAGYCSMRSRYEADSDSSGLLRLLELPDAGWELVLWIVRRGEATAAEAAVYTGQDAEAARAALDALVSQGAVEKRAEGPEPRYRAGLGRRRGRSLPASLWIALSEAAPPPAPDERAPKRRCFPAAPRAGRFAPAKISLGSRERRLLCMSPLVAGFLLTQWLLFRGGQNFTGLINFLGLILISVIAGIFPVLLLAASRRKGEFVPGYAWRPLGSAPVLAVIYLLFLSSLLGHGLFLWQSLPARAAALAMAALTMTATVLMARRGAFAPRAVVELRASSEGQMTMNPSPSRQESESMKEEMGSVERAAPTGAALSPQAVFAVMSDGQPLAAEVRMEYATANRKDQGASGEVADFAALRSVTFALPPTQARELKVWAHRVMPEGDSEPLPATAEVKCGPETRRVDLGLRRGQILLPISPGACQVRIILPAPQGGYR
jgi:amino acid permease